ncbi:hypothetical protein NMG60_11004494 [Bertholletia excelsa]
MAEGGKAVQEELSLPILLADRVIKSAQEAESSKGDCGELAKQADRLSQKLRAAARIIAAAAPGAVYERPLRRIAADVSKNLDRALTLTRKCRRRSGFFPHLFAITTSGDFRRAAAHLDSSAADLAWLLSIFDDSEGGANLSLPPIASNDPTLAMLWSSIASVQMGQLRDRVDSADYLASLALINDRNKKMIVEEGGASPEAQVAASTALLNLGNDQERVQSIAGEFAVQVIVKVLGDSPMRVQVAVANLVARMAEMDPETQEEFGRANVTRPLLTWLSMDIVLGDTKLESGKTSIHSLVEMNKELARNPFINSHHSNSSSSLKKERSVESPELKLELKISCANALCKLSRESLLNSRKITETKGLLCLAKLIEKEKGELQTYCLMVVMELAAVAELNTELRRAAFKPNSPAAKAVLEQLLRVIDEENSPTLLIPAIKSIGYLSRTFPAKETRIISPLVTQLEHRNADVATEAVIALTKFASPDNFNCVDHSKAIIICDGVPRLVNVIRTNSRDQVHGLVLLCYLALNVGNSKALEQARALNVIEGTARSILAQYPEQRELFAKTIHHLTLYQAGAHNHRQGYAT